MEMIMSFLLFSLAVIGMTHIIVDSSIFRPVRELLKRVLPSSISSVFDCYQCAGTWCGFLLGFLLVSKDPIIIFSCGMAGSFLANLAANLLNVGVSKAQYYEANAVVNFQEEKK
jgi:1-aminocyclopropane-1-carboxylate deaminase/D-cysteine desulfhydrase-like pyridoxal-dependent ACC family enzyme